MRPHGEYATALPKQDPQESPALNAQGAALDRDGFAASTATRAATFFLRYLILAGYLSLSLFHGRDGSIDRQTRTDR